MRTLLTALLLSSLALSTHAQETSPPKLTLISNVNIFDGTTDQLHENKHVLIKDNLIEQISDEPLMITALAGNTVIDGKGMTLMPGPPAAFSWTVSPPCATAARCRAGSGVPSTGET